MGLASSFACYGFVKKGLAVDSLSGLALETLWLAPAAAVVTVEFTGRGATTLMTFTEQAVFGDPRDGDIRESGTGIGFDRLCEEMAATPA